MTGDVFSGAQIPGVRQHEFIMLIAHPCTMRRGPDLLAKLQAVPVVEYEHLPLERWVDGYVRVLPLPAVLSEQPGRGIAAQLSECGMVETDNLQRANRLACLSELGVALALQRFFYCLSRVRVKIETIAAEAQANMEEAALQEEWNEVIAGGRAERGEDLGVVLEEEAGAFHAFLEKPAAAPDTKLRDGLVELAERPTVRRFVAAERIRRAEELGL